MKQQLTLSQFIFLLSRIEPDQIIRYDFGGFRPTDFDSYRGYYDQLALGFTDDPELSSPTAEDLLQKAKDCVGKEFQGYKGGDYVMDEHTPIWVANYSRCHDTAIVGIHEDGFIETAYVR